MEESFLLSVVMPKGSIWKIRVPRRTHNFLYKESLKRQTPVVIKKERLVVK